VGKVANRRSPAAIRFAIVYRLAAYVAFSKGSGFASLAASPALPRRPGALSQSHPGEEKTHERGKVVPILIGMTPR
jgi:hypothetical protein